MNINAINQVSLRNKIMKVSELRQQPVPTEGPVSKPDEVMNVLNAQAMNNIAFQGLNASALAKAGKKIVLPAIAAAGLALTACDPEAFMPQPTDIDVTVNVETNVDVSAVTALLQQLLEQGKINAQQQAEYNAKMLALVEALQNGQITKEEFDKYMQELKDLLNSIDNTLKDIKEVVTDMAEDIAKISEDLSEMKDSTYNQLNTLIEQGKFNNEALQTLIEGQKSIEKDLAAMRANTDSLIVIASDSTKYDKLIEAIEDSKADPIDYAKFEAMFEAYGISVSDAVKLSAEELKALLTEWKDNYLALEEKQIVLLGEILKQTQDLAERPGLDLANVEKAIKELQEAYQTGNKDLLGSLNGIQNTLDEIDASIDAIYDKLGAYADQVTTYHEIFVKQFDIAIELLLDNGLTLEALKDEQNATNKKLDAFAPKADELIKLMQEFVNKGYGDFPMDKFIEYMEGYGDANIKNLRELFIEMGLDKLDENTAPLKEYKESLESILSEIKANGGKLDTIISLIEQLLAKGYTLDELKVVLLDVQKEHECNCDCGDGDDNHEGILDDFKEKLEGLV